LVENKFSWDTHQVQIAKPALVKQTYEILAESERNPVIIEHFNTITVQFYISNNYPESIKVLQNFIRKKMGNIHTYGRIDISLEAAI